MTLTDIHERQSALMNQYHAIEVKVMCGSVYPTRITQSHETQNVHCQEHIRAIIWRGFEELCEAGREELHSDAFKEELIDALHFFTEVNLFCGWSYLDLAPMFHDPMFVTRWKESGVQSCRHTFKADIGILMAQYADATYCLKSKPWKQSPKVTDWGQFKEELARAYFALLLMLSQYLSHDELLEIYFKKAGVNQTRQETGY